MLTPFEVTQDLLHPSGPKRPSTKQPNSKEETSAPRGGTARLLSLRPGGKNRVLLVLRCVGCGHSM